MPLSDPFDPDALRLSGANFDAPRPLVPPRLPRHRPGEKFLRGPIPWDWLQHAARLRGSALHAAVLLWFEAGCRKSQTVSINLTRAAEFRLSPDTMSRALRELETAGLVSVQRPPGRCLQVTILDAPAVPNAAAR
jgi:hypothetical protein